MLQDKASPSYRAPSDGEEKQRPITHSTDEAVEEALYAQRQQIYPRQVHGSFATWRVIMVCITLGIYYILPWINWGEGRQAFLIDLPGRKFNLFFWTLDRKSTRLNSSHMSESRMPSSA